MAKATIVSGSGVAPGYGKVTNAKKKPASFLVGGAPNSMQTSLQASGFGTRFTPSPAPAYTPPAGPGGSPPKFDINNLPVDPGYDSQIAGLTRTRDTTVTGLQGQRRSTLIDYGYSESGDPANPTLSFDPSNPYSVAAQMKKRYDEAKTGNTNNYAARGQLYAGSLNNAQSATDSNYSSSSDNLQKKLIAFLQQNTRDQTQAQTDFETNSGGAFGDRVSRALSASSANTDAPTSSPSPAGPSPIDQYKAQISAGTSVKTAYTNPQGHPVRILANGTKQVSLDGGRTWRNV